jgi:hypothetical protein
VDVGLAASLAVLLHIKPSLFAIFRTLLIFAPIHAPMLPNLGSLVVLALSLSAWLLRLGTLPIGLHVGPSVGSTPFANLRPLRVFALICATALSLGVVF